jgi:hypothetical protein
MRLLALLLALVVTQVFWFQRETSTEKRLGEIASWVAGAEVNVYCPSIWRRLVDISSSQGTAHYRSDGSKGGQARLTHKVCGAFENEAEEGFRGSYDCLLAQEPSCPDGVYELTRAVHVLTHEAVHLSGIHDEAVTECYAVQTDAAVARRLGATEAQAHAIAAYMYLGNALAPPPYRFSSDCRPRSRLDLHPETAAWPS